MKVIKHLTLFLLLTVIVNAQNIMTSSPYSMFGIGEIVTGLYGSNSAMGGVSTGMRGTWLLNTENPAGLTGLDTHWYMAAGVTPYSAVGYYFQSTEPLEGSPGSYYTSTFEGYGGLSKVYLTNAFMLGKNLSAGVNVSYIFGNTKLTESQSSISVENRMYTHAFYADFGLQYHRQIGKETAFTIGAVYGYKQRLSIENSIAIVYSSSETEESKRNTTQYLPQFAGIGGSLTYKKCTYALDYDFHQYSSLSSGDSRVKFRDSHKLRLGFDYSPNGYSSSSFWKRSSYKAGVNLSTPYLQINGQKGYAYRFSAGMGLPVTNGRINVALYYDKTQLNNDVYGQSTFGMTVTYTLSELFYKLKL